MAKNGAIPSKRKRTINLKKFVTDRQTDGQMDRQTESTTKYNRLL